MNLENEALKTNEFLRRRKLRLQQVREQSKDIAKKIRQRAKVEKLRAVVELDAKKQQEYFERQDKFVKHLEVLYTRGLENVGASHQSASDLACQDEANKVDLSKSRGKEAAAELRRLRQEKLDEQKKLLDRRLQAREAANELSREKSSVLAGKLATKSTASKLPEELNQKAADASVATKDNKKDIDKSKTDSENIKTTDIGTQWDMENVPNDWEQVIPALSLPKDDKSPNDFELINLNSKSEKGRRLDLFATSKEMPTSLQGRHQTERDPSTLRPSLTLVSEYLQSRKLRLREPDCTSTNKKPLDDIPSLKQTIQRTRVSKPEEVSGKSSCTNEKASRDSLNRKNSVTMYNHSTRNTQDHPCGDYNLVVRDTRSEEDAYSQAMKESSLGQGEDEVHQKKVQDMRNRVAMTKQNVEKEYKDTINFLNSIPKTKGGKVIKRAYMDHHREQSDKEQRQHKLQQEYRRIEKDCKRHQSCLNKSHTKQKSPLKRTTEDDIDNQHFQYSWMPVPEGDGNLAIHTIPNNKEARSNSVKFSQVDSYHEYRSRHKHTPPTKDNDRTTNKQNVVTNNVTSESSDTEVSITSDTSSVESMMLQKKSKKNKRSQGDKNLSDAERIIIYKILDTKNDKKSKQQTKLLSDIAKSLSSMENLKPSVDNEAMKDNNINEPMNKKSVTTSLGELNEGVYKVANSEGDNMNSLCFEDSQHGGVKISNEKHKHLNSSKTNVDNKTSSNPLHWQCGEDSNREQLGNTTPSAKIASTVTSTSSFKTATTSKPNSHQPDGGFIKLVDETGQEAGKFFIGASGFLNNNNYEVVIQLRKKDDANSGKEQDIIKETVNKHCDNKKNKKAAGINVKNPQKNANSAPLVDNELREVLGARNMSDSDSQRILPQRVEHVADIVDDVGLKENTPTVNTKVQCEVTNDLNDDNYLRLIKSTHERKMVDKGVHTSFKMEEMTKSETISRPATTTCTQTSSPNNRPVFYHMSSSTSTAYMSPPEIILPNLRQERYKLPHDDIYSAVADKEQYCDGYLDCTCKKCRKGRCRRNQNRIGDKDKYSNENNIETPPNTATSCAKHKYITDDNSTLKLDDAQISKCGCCKCVSHDRSKEPIKRCKKSLKNIKETGSNKFGKKINTRCSANANLNIIHKKLPSNHDKIKTKLNPSVKQYVNKLLALNKEGLRAIEVANQNCSSVTTPGSSIINVPCNIDDRKSSIHKISLEQIKDALKQRIIKESLDKNVISRKSPIHSVGSKCYVKNTSSRTTRKRSVHKVKSLNISRKLITKSRSKRLVSLTSTDDNFKPQNASRPIPVRSKARGKSSPTPRPMHTSEQSSRFNDSENSGNNSSRTEYSKRTTKTKSISPTLRRHGSDHMLSHRARKPLITPDFETTGDSHVYKERIDLIPTAMSTQTNKNIGDDRNFMKLAEDKLNNIEKIADLTEKCTKRLSNLAKVLDEVRKNKSLVYSHISTSDSADSQSDKGASSKVADVEPIDSQTLEMKTPEPHVTEKDQENAKTEFVSFLTNIPKPTSFKIPEVSPPPSSSINKSILTDNMNVITPSEFTKRPKPPPALTRTKHGHDLIPHELSTVIEVDSPMSVKRKSLRSRNDTIDEMNDSNSSKKSTKEKEEIKHTNKKCEVPIIHDVSVNPDLIQSNAKLVTPSYKLSTGESSDDSKFQMIDLKHFNEIMLEPFISINEYAKQLNIEPPDEGSHIERPDEGSHMEEIIQRDDLVNDDFSSLHSDGSLPDVIAELLKRNIIAEPFKFDTVSNVNSTTVSSESTLSMLAFSKIKKGRKKTVLFNNKENIAETSDTLSISSNPDLENAFKKLGMGWASSTLKKTKERLALSSSSNTSSSSMSQFKIKSFSQDIPVIVTDTVSSVINQSRKGYQGKNTSMNSSKHAEQQTSLVNSMTVKEFLTNELAKKITFNNKSDMMNDTEGEFVSLFETKMPDEMKQALETNRDEVSVDSMRNSTNRARTSTPVQLYKSMTYHSSSSSNMSNGLFSNADDLSSVKMTSNSNKNHSTSEKDDLTIPNFSLRMKKSSECSKSDD